MRSTLKTRVLTARIQKKLHRSLCWIMTVVFLITTEIPIQTLKAQPVPVNPLVAPSFQSTDLDPAFQQAANAPNQSAWEAIVQQGYTAAMAAWEAGIDAQITSAVSAISQNDAYNTTANYQDYLLNELLVQKQTAMANYQLAASATVDARRLVFEATASSSQQGAQQEATYQTLQQGAATNPASEAALKKIQELQDSWQKEFQSDLSQGLEDYQRAINNVDQQYQQILSQISQKDAEFQNAQAIIKAYEQNVRNAISTAVAGLQTMLTTSGQFYTQSCDAQNVCNATTTLDPLHGQPLQDLINQMTTGLTNGTSLSTLAGTMITYLQGQQAYADYQVTNVWTPEINKAASYDPGQQTNEASLIWGTNWAGGMCELFGCQGWLGYNDPARVSYIKQHWAGNSTNLISFLQGNESYKEVTAVTSAYYGADQVSDAYYYTGPLAYGGGDQDYSRRGTGGNTFSNCVNWACGLFDDGLFYQRWQTWVGWDSNTQVELEPFIHYSISYTTKDPNAQDNADTWAGYRDSITTNLGNWQNSILPSLQTWETQVNQFNADYASFLAQAAAQTSQAQSQRDQQISDIVSNRNDYENSMKQQYTEGMSRWNALRADALKHKALNQTTLASMVAPASHSPNINPADYGLKMDDGFKALLGAPMPKLPDTKLLDNVAAAFTGSLQASGNLATMAKMNDEAIAQQKAVNDQIMQMALSQQGVLGHDDGLTVTQVGGSIVVSRSISTGHAALNAGGNIENAADYHSINMTQSFTLQTAGAVKLAKPTGDLFGAWNTNDVLNQFQMQQDAYGAKSDAQLQSVSGALNDANQYAFKNEEAWHEDAQGQAAAATERRQMVEAIAQAMLGGASLGQAVAQQVQQKAGQVIGEAMGIPPEIISALLGGASVKSALKSYVNGQVQNAIWTAVGDATSPEVAQLLQQLYSKKQADKAAKKAKQQQQINTVVAVAAVVAAPFTAGASMAVAAGVMAGMGAAQGYASGGLKGAIVGAAGGALNGVVGSYTGGAVQVGLSWSPENGYGASVSAGIGPATVSVARSEYGGTTAGIGIGFGNGVGVGLTTNTKTGTTSASVGYTSADGSTKIGGNLSYNKDTGYSGGVGVQSGNIKASLSYSKAGGVSAYAGATNAMGTVSGGIGYSKAEGASVSGQMGTNKDGAAKIGYSEKQGASAALTSQYGSLSTSQKGGTTLSVNATDGVKLEYNTKTGFSGSAKIGDVTLSYSEKGGLSGSMDLNGKTVSYGAKTGLNTSDTPAGGGENLIMTSMDGLMGGLDSMAQKNRDAVIANKAKGAATAHRDNLKKGPNALTDAQIDAAIKADPLGPGHALAALDEKMNGTNAAGTIASGQTVGADAPLMDRIGQGVTNFARNAFAGEIASGNAYVDSQGNFVESTCFVAGTLVRVPGPGEGKHAEAEGISLQRRTERGMVERNGQYFLKIEEIQVGDLVMTVDPETGRMFPAPVTETFVHKVNNVRKLTYADGSEISTTWNHPFYVKGRGWTEARYLAGSESVAVNAEPQWRAVKAAYVAGAADPMAAYGGVRVADSRTMYTNSLVKVYNIEVEGTHAYLVGENGVLVHNYVQAAIPVGAVVVGGAILITGACAANKTCREGVNKTLGYDPKVAERGLRDFASDVIDGATNTWDSLTNWAEDHTKDARPSTQEKHEKGQERKKRDGGGERADPRRRPPRQRPPNHTGPWPPAEGSFLKERRPPVFISIAPDEKAWA